MNPRELKNHLYRLVEKNGKSSITKPEYEYMAGRINYRTYLNSCYADYAKGNLSKNKN